LRSRSGLVLLLLGAAAGAAGCGDAYQAGPLAYAVSPQLGTQLEGKPKLQAEVAKAMTALYGPDPREMRVPAGSPLPEGGKYLARRAVVESGGKRSAPQPVSYKDPASGKERPAEGGFALYQQQCLHCHGISGDGSGPTSTFLWPRPRDFRKGVFKFTSTTGAKPTRDDLRRVLVNGIPNTAMPSFEALLSPGQIEQVLDYLIFLTLRGETELALINEASALEETDAATAFDPEILGDITGQQFELWKAADDQVLQPPPRVASTAESVARGKELYLGRTAEKLQCAGCHGDQGKGNGPSFVPKAVFDDVVFRGKPIEGYPEAIQKLWKEGSLDDWGQPLRPANINNGAATMYKGGRRPIDLYWRIAKGINGAKMPAHDSALKPEQIWDLVNFVLALPYQPDLLTDGPAGTAAPAPAAAAGVAAR
jgi:mono/diheme cytochrome c family protein